MPLTNLTRILISAALHFSHAHSPAAVTRFPQIINFLVSQPSDGTLSLNAAVRNRQEVDAITYPKHSRVFHENSQYS
jgi:hypothetical protein